MKHSGRMVNKHPSFFASCIRFSALVMFSDLLAVTVNCNTATRIPIINIIHNNSVDKKKYYLLGKYFILPEKLEAILNCLNKKMNWCDIFLTEHITCTLVDLVFNYVRDNQIIIKL